MIYLIKCNKNMQTYYIFLILILKLNTPFINKKLTFLYYIKYVKFDDCQLLAF